MSKDFHPNDCTTNFSEWTTVSVIPITGYVNIFDDPEAPGGHGYGIDPSPAVLLQESSYRDEGEHRRVTRVVFADVGRDEGDLDAACDNGNFVASIPQDEIGQWITDHPKEKIA